MTPFSKRSGAVALTLVALSLTPSQGLAQTARLSPTAAPTGGTLTVDAASLARGEVGSLPVTAGGPVEHPGCGGFVTARPQAVLNIIADVLWLRVYATSGNDVSLAVLGPNGQWRCADDTYGTHPSIDGRFRRGVYRVWIATAQANATAPATVTATATRAQVPTASAGAVGADPERMTRDATGLAQQVLGGLLNNGAAQPAQPASQPPLAVPRSTLSRAGLSPATLPPALDTVLRQPDTGVGALTPTQLTELTQLAGSGLNASQLQSVAGALLNGGAAQPTLSPAQLSQLATLARNGASNSALQQAAATMLRGAPLR